MPGWVSALGVAVAFVVASAAGMGWTIGGSGEGAGRGPGVRPHVERTVTLRSVADGYVWSSPQGAGIGGGERLVVGVGSGYGTAMATIKFDLSTLGAGATVRSAALRFTAAMEIPLRGEPYLGVRVAEAPAVWDEDTITWESFNGVVGELVASTSIVGRSDRTYELDATETVKVWLSGTRPNYGLILAPPETATGDFIARVWAREKGETLGPQLTITYDAPVAPTPTVAGTATPTATPFAAGPTATPTATPLPTATPRPAGPTKVYLPAMLKQNRGR